MAVVIVVLSGRIYLGLVIGVIEESDNLLRDKCVDTVLKYVMTYHDCWFPNFYRGADKSLARPGRKQATTTKL